MFQYRTTLSMLAGALLLVVSLAAGAHEAPQGSLGDAPAGTRVTDGVVHPGSDTDDLAVGGTVCNTAKACIDAATGNIRSDGEVEARVFNATPDQDNGSCVRWGPCEGGTGCVAEDAGKTVSICAPNNSSPFPEDKVRYGIQTCTWTLSDTGVDQSDVGKFLPSGDLGAALTLSPSGHNQGNSRGTAGCYTEDYIWIEKCWFYLPPGMNNWTDTADYVDFDLVVFDHGNSDNELNAAFQVREIGGTFCETENCLGGAAGQYGNYRWNVQKGYARSGSRLSLNVELDAKGTNNVETIRGNVMCEVW